MGSSHRAYPRTRCYRRRWTAVTLRHRRPDQHIEPLHSSPAETQPEPVTQCQKLKRLRPGRTWHRTPKKMDRVAKALREISARLDEAALRQAQEAGEGCRDHFYAHRNRKTPTPLRSPHQREHPVGTKPPLNRRTQARWLTRPRSPTAATGHRAQGDGRQTPMTGVIEKGRREWQPKVVQPTVRLWRCSVHPEPRSATAAGVWPKSIDLFPLGAAPLE